MSRSRSTHARVMRRLRRPSKPGFGGLSLERGNFLGTSVSTPDVVGADQSLSRQSGHRLGRALRALHSRAVGRLCALQQSGRRSLPDRGARRRPRSRRQEPCARRRNGASASRPGDRAPASRWRHFAEALRRRWQRFGRKLLRAVFRGRDSRRARLDVGAVDSCVCPRSRAARGLEWPRPRPALSTSHLPPVALIALIRRCG
jgi:hypothetical protein